MTGTVRFPLERAQSALDSLRSDASDEQFAAAIADVLLAVRPHGLIRLGIQFDARNAPCPVPVDKAAREWCSITFADKDHARAWIIKAALTGCTVARITNERGTFRGPDLFSESVRHVRDRKRHREQRAAMTPEQRKAEADADEIPF